MAGMGRCGLVADRFVAIDFGRVRPNSMEGGYLALIAQNLIGGRADRRLGHVADLVGVFCHRSSFT